MICGDCTKLYVVSNQQLLLNHVQRSLNKTNNSLGKLKIGKHKLQHLKDLSFITYEIGDMHHL